MWEQSRVQESAKGYAFYVIFAEGLGIFLFILEDLYQSSSFY